MATNKHATIRYHALDRCFSNVGKKYFMENLLEACGDAIYTFTGTSEGISRRQIFEDIKFMESEQGWSIPLQRCKDGKKVYYRYSDSNYSIKKQAINESEANQLKETLLILTRFKGMPQFDWIEEQMVRIEEAFNLGKNKAAVVGFEQNIFLKGLNHFTELFNAIQFSKVLEITYQGFRQPEPVEMVIHPYYLKQYNNRWFLFGLNDHYRDLSNLALDRIIGIRDLNQNYMPNNEINFDEYFDDVIGVTVDSNILPNNVILEVSKSMWSYVETKPLHGSQKVISKNETTVTIQLTVQLNYELTAMIFGFGGEIKVIAPKELKAVIKDKAEDLLKRYL